MKKKLLLLNIVLKEENIHRMPMELELQSKNKSDKHFLQVFSRL